MPKRQRHTPPTFIHLSPIRPLVPTRAKPPVHHARAPTMLQARTKAATLLTSAMLLLTQPDAALALTPPQKLVAEAWRVVDQSYVDRSFNSHDWFSVRMRAVKRAYASMDDAYVAIRSMLSLLEDPYTRFLTREQLTSLTSSATGELGGVGVEMYPARIGNNLKVTSPLDGSPAARAGVKPADVITLIDGEDTEQLTPDEAAARIRGRPGTSVSLTVVHDGGKGREESFEMVRENLKLQSVSADVLAPREVYVKIKQFNSSTAGDVNSALKGGFDRVVLDLRDNPGGYFPAGVDVARLFLKSGTPIVYVVDRNGVQDEIDTVVDGVCSDASVVVLVNSATASASEILAGALKDNARATLVGEQTFGKGVVQTVAQLSDGSGVAVTIARYETPGHNNINKIGIAPDVKEVCSRESSIESCLPPDVWEVKSAGLGQKANS